MHFRFLSQLVSPKFGIAFNRGSQDGNLPQPDPLGGMIRERLNLNGGKPLVQDTFTRRDLPFQAEDSEPPPYRDAEEENPIEIKVKRSDSQKLSIEIKSNSDDPAVQEELLAMAAEMPFKIYEAVAKLMVHLEPELAKVLGEGDAAKFLPYIDMMMVYQQETGTSEEPPPLVRWMDRFNALQQRDEMMSESDKLLFFNAVQEASHAIIKEPQQWQEYWDKGLVFRSELEPHREY